LTVQTLLIIDDEPNLLYSLQAGLETEELTVATAKTAKQGLALIPKVAPDAVIVDVRLPDMSGLELFEKIKALDPRLPVVVITAFAATETAIEAMKRGAFEYMLKPVDLHHLREVVTRALALRRLQSVPAVCADARVEGAPDQIVGRSPAMQEVYKAIGRVAPQDVTVLVLGESGTGKELVARALYQHSKRADKPFVAINCAAIRFASAAGTSAQNWAWKRSCAMYRSVVPSARATGSSAPPSVLWSAGSSLPAYLSASVNALSPVSGANAQT
jgi:two-component system nitrogen regulation response regulator GlnG